ncbi:MAG TPA: RND transporter [Thermoanaerobaculia bacterium]|nr:RND transporter [Thermoanaerobaculia bacterium]
MPYALLVPLAVIFALIPFGAPHLLEKLRMLFDGTLRRPLDWFDLIMHGAPLLLLAIKLIRSAKRFVPPS